MSTTSTAASTSTAVGKGNAFSPIGSPPLILAFLAIGLFSAAMVFVFGWRRIQLRRGWRFASVEPVNRSDVELPIVHAKIPKLWDLSNEGRFAWGQVRGDEKGGVTSGLEDDVNWASLMPLSLSAKVVSGNTAGRRAELPRYPLNNFLNTTPSLNPLSWWNQRRSRYDDEKESASDGTKMTMQVAITIALPSSQHPIHIRNRGNDKHHHHEAEKDIDRQKMTDYCIGMYECSWH